MGEDVFVRPDAPKESSPLFTVIDEEPPKAKQKDTVATNLPIDDNDEEQSEEAGDEKNFLTSLVPLLISMKIWGIGMSLSETLTTAISERRGHARCHWTALEAGGGCSGDDVRWLLYRRPDICGQQQRTVECALDTVSNIVTMASALIVYFSMHQNAATLGRMLRKLSDDTDVEIGSHIRETEDGTPPSSTPPGTASNGSHTFFVTFGAWALAGLAVVSKLARCYVVPTIKHSDTTSREGVVGEAMAAADCLRGNGTLCANPAAVVNLTEVTVRYGLLRGVLWMSMLLAYYTFDNIAGKLKGLNFNLFVLPSQRLDSKTVRSFRCKHNALCRILKCSVAWYLHCMVDTLATADQFIAFASGDLWCLPFRVSVAVNAACLLAMLVSTSEAAHRASKGAQESVVVLAQRSAELSGLPAGMYEQINATLNSFRRGA
ncbi:hypothetical protein HPB48_022563 [Haemaphysalis longicornis]|uniref:Uncharacterized protein n=1 Tax=Haemaphysalis longicornis TaxID=44386 RepID=A0A9J6H5Q1_HAELO|nr:hypothetical protein HPB48_022563 [Haemaphysalis longicornis]